MFDMRDKWFFQIYVLVCLFLKVIFLMYFYIGLVLLCLIFNYFRVILVINWLLKVKDFFQIKMRYMIYWQWVNFDRKMIDN